MDYFTFIGDVLLTVGVICLSACGIKLTIRFLQS